jgi:glutamyl-tRNA synthetase
MLMSPDGRRLSKRDKDLDLGVLRQNMRPEALLGILASSAGIIDRNVSISAAELSREFKWENLHKEDIYLQIP